MQTFKPSKRGKILIKESRNEKIEQARTKRMEEQGKIEKAWDMDKIFLREASKILEPDKNWDNIETFAVSLSSWRRFREATYPIKPDTFKAFCKVLDLKWQEVVQNDVESRINISEAPDLSSFYGRTPELAELQKWLIQKRCRLVVVHGMGGIGKSALARRLVNKITDKYDYIIWISLASSPPFSEILLKLGQFLSQGENEADDITQIMQYLHDQKCLIVLDGWEEITGNESGDYINYSTFVERVATEAHRSSLLLLTRKVTHNIAILKDQLIPFQQLGGLKCEEALKIFKAEGISGTDIKLEELSKRYSNPLMIKVIAQQVKTVFSNDISPFIDIDRSIFVTDAITEFLDNQFKILSTREINLIYWVAIRRNSASWNQLLQDNQEFLSDKQLFKTLNNLIARHSFLDKNIKDIPILYILDPVILKYTTERFVEENYQEIIQVFNSQNIQGNELFITHSFITKHPQDEELNQQQMRQIVKPIQKMLLAKLCSQQQLRDELQNVISLLKNQGLSLGYAYQNISHLISGY
ncbi:NB-ARC domain-containing protein [Nodularia sphaerocarpa]|uniref:NB-ARC domain-containing protein n=1 Tax=Nodularia sphaerocarpa TaxID=137816 RepID=UPI001EFB7A79|nr:NB-ARC domain-containing protein [Nodularia sphaerocarpa]MDB9373837.1 NB-ARC domain-containing protein [Nodularia sphaerocarpa CS-585]MDB9380402.1 NB-ARC domain-containing protein [Nodularia sphaerocarpa CS-585A2]ULP72855.1 hypothetical protein BDGGKGIB_02506 [Nodularia sphaerocarpa UHCC 0038]